MTKQDEKTRNDLKIAIVQDALVVPAGSERVALSLSDLFPDAPIFTSAYLPENTFPEFKSRLVRTLPFSRLITNERQFKNLYPLWLAELSLYDFSKFDLVISNANYLAKFINWPKSTIHVCYLHNPVRFLWKSKAYSKDSLPFGSISLPIIKKVLPVLQKMDVRKTRKINYLIANSKNIANQIQMIYSRESEVIYPPVEIQAFSISNSIGDYYLYAGRLISHKRVDIAIDACRQLGRKLIVAGEGLEREKLQELAGKAVEFTGRVNDQELAQLYANCKALLFPSDEDFGLVPVEAQACGRPVIAFRSGGAMETVIEGETGLFFNEQTTDSLVEAMQRFEALSFDPLIIRQNAMNYDVSVFRGKFGSFIEKVISQEGAKIEKQQ